MTEDQVRSLLLKKAKKFAHYKGTTGLRPWCATTGVNYLHTTEFANGKRGPSGDMLSALGLIVTYSKAPK